jgi:hypothetical protein
MSANIDFETRKLKNKRILKWFGIGVVAVFIINGISSVLDRSQQEAARAEARVRDSLQSAVKLRQTKRHDSLMANDSRYRDSVVIADKRRADSTNAQRRLDSIASDERDRMLNPDKYVEIDMNWHKGGFGAVALARFTIDNRSRQILSNPVIKVSFYSDNGTLIRTKEEVIYLTVKPGKRTRSKEINLGFVSEQIERAGAKLVSGTWK